MEVTGTLAMFDGPASPITQTFGWDSRSRSQHPSWTGSNSSSAPAGHRPRTNLLIRVAIGAEDLLSARGYSPIETPSCRSSGAARDSSSSRVTVRESGTATPRCGPTAGQNTGLESAELAAVEGFSAVIRRARGSHCSSRAGRHTGCRRALNVSNGIALFAGTSTIPTAGAGRAAGALSKLARVRSRPGHRAGDGGDGTGKRLAAERESARSFGPYTRDRWQLS
jgi:hypothetical protein